jgi:hypothetical protein
LRSGTKKRSIVSSCGLDRVSNFVLDVSHP